MTSSATQPCTRTPGHSLIPSPGNAGGRGASHPPAQLEERTCRICGDAFDCKPDSKKQLCSSYCRNKAKTEGIQERNQESGWGRFSLVSKQ